MGCTTSRESNRDLGKSATILSNELSPHASPHGCLAPPPLPTTRTPKRKASMPCLENPQRKWQRRQMGEELFSSAKTTPERKPLLPQSSCKFLYLARDAVCFVTSCLRGKTGWEVETQLTIKQGTCALSPGRSPLCDGSYIPCGPNCKRRQSDDVVKYPPGTALPYVPQHFPPSPQPTSSTYSEPPITPSNQFRRSQSYRSYSGRPMYSPANFPLSSSPYGSPTIRVVAKSEAEPGDHQGRKNKDDNSVSDTTLGDDIYR